MPWPVAMADRLLAWATLVGLLLLLVWALYLRLRHRPPHPRTLPRVLAAVNIVAVVVLMAQTSGFTAFALHGFKAVQNINAAREQARPTATTQPRHLPPS